MNPARPLSRWRCGPAGRACSGGSCRCVRFERSAITAPNFGLHRVFEVAARAKDLQSLEAAPQFAPGVGRIFAILNRLCFRSRMHHPVEISISSVPRRRVVAAGGDQSRGQLDQCDRVDHPYVSARVWVAALERSCALPSCFGKVVLDKMRSGSQCDGSAWHMMAPAASRDASN